MPWAGFELQTLEAANSDEDHYTMPLPLEPAIFARLALQQWILFDKKQDQYGPVSRLL